MESIKDLLCFLNELDFFEQKNNGLIEKLRCVKQRLIIEFEDYNVSKLINVLNIVDDMNVSIIPNELKDSVERKTLYEKVFYT